MTLFISGIFCSDEHRTANISVSIVQMCKYLDGRIHQPPVLHHVLIIKLETMPGPMLISNCGSSLCIS